MRHSASRYMQDGLINHFAIFTVTFKVYGRYTDKNKYKYIVIVIISLLICPILGEK